MFGVYEDGKPASIEGYPYLKNDCWKNHKFKTWDEAEEYLRYWMGRHWVGSVPIIFELPFKFNYYGVLFEIRQELGDTQQEIYKDVLNEFMDSF